MSEVFGKYSIAIVTPFISYEDNSNQPVDYNALENIITHVNTGIKQIRNKIENNTIENNIIGGIICSGTTGEQHSLSLSEKLQLYENVALISRRLNLPFAFGISSTRIEDVLILVRKAVEIRSDGIMLGLPPYLRLCQEEIIDYVKMVKNIAIDIPILLYNNMLRNGYGASPETLVYLHQQGYIWGVKQASPTQADFFSDCNKMFVLDSTIKLYTGSDVLFKQLVFNTNNNNVVTHKFYGLTSILGNIFPYTIGSMVTDLFIQPNNDNNQNNESNNDIGVISQQSISKRQELLHELSDEVLIGCTLPVGLKYALKLKQIQGGESRKPVGYLSDSKKVAIHSKLDQFTNFIETNS